MDTWVLTMRCNLWKSRMKKGRQWAISPSMGIHVDSWEWHWLNAGDSFNNSGMYGSSSSIDSISSSSKKHGGFAFSIPNWGQRRSTEFASGNSGTGESAIDELPIGTSIQRISRWHVWLSEATLFLKQSMVNRLWRRSDSGHMGLYQMKNMQERHQHWEVKQYEMRTFTKRWIFMDFHELGYDHNFEPQHFPIGQYLWDHPWPVEYRLVISSNQNEKKKPRIEVGDFTKIAFTNIKW